MWPKGKKIFEGDIIKYQTTGSFDSEDTYEEVKEVSFWKGAFTPIFMSERDLHDYDDKPLVVTKLEVIGNIYENPELLK